MEFAQLWPPASLSTYGISAAIGPLPAEFTMSASITRRLV